MTGFALALVLTAAIVHATWNLLAKKAGGGTIFVWLYAATSTTLWAPLALPVLIAAWPRLGPLDWVFLIGSGLIHTGYFLLLQRAYQVGDLSIIYPLARGTGPTLAAFAGIAILGERPGGLAIAGAGLVALSIFMLAKHGGNSSGGAPKEAYALGVGTGVLIAFYTVWDKQAVASHGIPPMLMEWMTNVTRLVCLLPIALRRPGVVLREWRARRLYAILIGALSPLAYLLILFAMTFTPVSYIAPSREISILLATIFGARFLREGEHLRIIAASVMVLGVIFLAVG